MKSFYLVLLFTFYGLTVNASVLTCPDPPLNDDPCELSMNPPFDLTSTGIHSGTTCCARGSNDVNGDGSSADFENLVCSNATENAAVWYEFSPDVAEDGYSIAIEVVGEANESTISVEVYAGTTDQACGVGFNSTLAAICMEDSGLLKVGNCLAADEKFYIKINSINGEEDCTDFTISFQAETCELFANDCPMAAGMSPFQVITYGPFEDGYTCFTSCLDFACPEQDSLVDCSEFMEMPTVWFKIQTDDEAAQLFTTIESNGNWDPIWTVFYGSDCDDLTVVNFGGTPSCSNGDNTPELHQTSVFDDKDTYWIMVTADPESIPATGIDDGSFEICLATTINFIVCLGELEGGQCTDESLVFEVTERDNEDLPLEGPFCQGEEVTVHISFLYDATESGADWFIGLIPKFGEGWDMSEFDFNENVPIGNGQEGVWHEAGADLAPIIQEDVPTLCTYTDENGVLQICNLLCEPCMECPETGMQIGDPLPSGYFWISTGGNAGCDNDGSPGEGWGIGSTMAQIDWEFNLKVKVFDDLDACFEEKDLSISFQPFSDGVAGCWEDPVGECLIDRAMFSPVWEIGCSEIPGGVLAQGAIICNYGITDIPVVTAIGDASTIVVNSLGNPYVAGDNDYVFEGGAGIIADSMINTSAFDQIVQYEIYAVDADLACNGIKTVIDVVVRSSSLPELDKAACSCEEGCVTIGIESLEGYAYAWNTGDATSSIEVCPDEPTTYSLTIIDDLGCIKIDSIVVDCDSLVDECIIPEMYKLVYDFYFDIFADGERDSIDYSIGEGNFFLEPDHIFYLNINLGEDTLMLPEGAYDLVYSGYNLDNWVLTTDSVVNIFLDESQSCVKVEFGLSPIAPERDLGVYYYLNRWCNSAEEFTMVTKNKGTQVESGIMWTMLDESLLPEDFPAGATIDSFIAPNLVGWFFEDLVPGGSKIGKVDVFVPGPPDVPVGQVLNHMLYLELENSDGTVEEEYGKVNKSQLVLCSYDPNDKMVEPNAENGYTFIEEDELVYTIRFQNTGNAPATYIEIRDTLSEFLDVESVTYIQGSHDEYLTISRIEDRVLVFQFDNINLPDSTSDLEGSQGHLIFTVELAENVVEGTLIENTAHIYFDSNPAVVTNTTQNVLFPDMDGDGFLSVMDCNDEDADINPDAVDIPGNGIDEDCDGVDAEVVSVEEAVGFDVQITPNPSNDIFNITVDRATDVRYVVLDVMGREVRRGLIQGQQGSIRLGNEANGVYLLMLSTED
ncbi:MAG: hypothetical protein P1U56_20385, partial [Saprospiraceae bacterium]|nr:hypothetical protein [Saprospiraceae bacterium]